MTIITNNINMPNGRPTNVTNNNKGNVNPKTTSTNPNNRFTNEKTGIFCAIETVRFWAKAKARSPIISKDEYLISHHIIDFKLFLSLSDIIFFQNLYFYLQYQAKFLFFLG